MEATADGFVNLVSHPVVSVKGMGKAIGKLGRSVGGAFRSKEKGESSSFSEKIIGSSERELAKEFGVDVYTDNPYLSGMLKAMARSRAGGKGAVMVVKFFLPVAALVSVGITASGLNSAADQLVNDSTRADLFRLNKLALTGMGISEKEAVRFLNLPHYSPREATYMRVYLEKLASVPGHAKILEQAARAPSLIKARKILWETRLAAESIQKGQTYDKIETLSEGLALKQRNRIVLFTACDYLQRSPLADRIEARFNTLKKEWGASDLEIQSGAVLAPDFSPRGISKKDRLFLKAENE